MAAASIPSFYEFIIPQTLVGKLIGKHGNFVTQIKEKSNAMIIGKFRYSSLFLDLSFINVNILITAFNRIYFFFKLFYLFPSFMLLNLSREYDVLAALHIL